MASRTREDWARIAHGTDACAEVVLTMEEAAEHPQLAARATIIGVPGHDGDLQAAPAPRFSRTPGRLRSEGDVAMMLRDWGR